ncbi:hypothetical protein [Actinoplanes aureus]|uniref:Uncharacterized protein n=1 Tax=Actinoplanes aureus TaxID=2792083 RepID=A0A931CCK4_9ACTN|nr:hypothetical protein [Actinoplanes aureus]MBG0564653.1 hypothetical protein [Actinoplanes aureus]
MTSKDLVLVDCQQDRLVRVPLAGIAGWEPAAPRHAWITSDERTVYLATDAVPPFHASIAVLRLHSVDWDAGTADVRLLQILRLDPAGTPSDMPHLAQVDPRQPIMPWSRPFHTQTNGPAFLPHSPFTYVTHCTDDRIRGFRIDADGTLTPAIVYSERRLTRQTHGIDFNPAGTLGLGVGYDYDLSEVRVYRPDRGTGDVRVTHTIRLGTATRYGSFAHAATWLDDRYAYVGAMQAGPTSRTPLGAEIVGPSVWLIDTHENTGQLVIPPTAQVEGAGMFRSPSDVAIANGKLYVAEEDAWTGRPCRPDDGFVSIWDLSDPGKPHFIKRFRPDQELPADFRDAHTTTATADEESVFVSSFASDHLIRIDTGTDKIAKVYTAADGLSTFHGEFAAGRNR